MSSTQCVAVFWEKHVLDVEFRVLVLQSFEFNQLARTRSAHMNLQLGPGVLAQSGPECEVPASSNQDLERPLPRAYLRSGPVGKFAPKLKRVLLGGRSGSPFADPCFTIGSAGD